eukprot:Ihof_evm4s111 gene=Ihof_evmTU4s111
MAQLRKSSRNVKAAQSATAAVAKEIISRKAKGSVVSKAVSLNANTAKEPKDRAVKNKKTEIVKTIGRPKRSKNVKKQQEQSTEDAEMEEEEEEERVESEEEKSEGESDAAEEEKEEEGEEEVETLEFTQYLPAPKKRKHVITTINKKEPQRTKKSKRAAIENAREIIETLKAGQSALQEDVDAWLAMYKRNKEKACSLLLSILVQACGCEANITVKQLSEEVEAVCEGIQDMFPNDTEDYPVRGSDKAAKKFRANLFEFWGKLLESCPLNALFDDYLLNLLASQWLPVLSSSAVRAFRHTSTLIVLVMIDAFVKIHKERSNKLDDTLRQLDAAGKKKKGANKAMIEELTNQQQTAHEQVNNLEVLFDDLFKQVFVHRFRDVCIDVRVACMRHLGRWMLELSQYWLHDKYLKYIGWQLSDKVPMVRLAAVETLCDLYSVEEYKPHLDNFTERFKPRLLEMVNDVDDTVAAEAIKALTLLVNSYDVLDDDDIKRVDDLIMVENRKICRAAGRFVKVHLLEGEVEDQIAQVMASKGKKKKNINENGIRLRALVDFYLERNHKHASYFVDSMWEHVGALQDFEVMCSMLFEEGSQSQGQMYLDMTDREETALIDIMVSAAQKAVGMLSLPGRGPRKLLSNKEKQDQADFQKRITDLYGENLPSLLVRYGADAIKVERLATLPLTFNLTTLVEGNHRNSTKSVVSQLCELVLKHTVQDTITACIQTLRTLQSEPGLMEEINVAVTTLTDDVEQRLETVYKEYTDAAEKGDVPEDLKVTLRVGIMRVKELYSAFNLARRDGLNQTIALIIDQGSDGGVDSLTTVTALQAISLCLMWKLSEIDPKAVDKESADGLGYMVEAFSGQLVTMLAFKDPTVRAKSFFLLNDLLLVFSRKLVQTSLRAVACEINEHAMEQLQTFVQDVLNDEVPLDKVIEGDVIEEDNEENDSQTEMIATHNLETKRLVLATFFKLVVYSVIRLEYCAPFVGLYLESDYREVVKHMFSKLREQNVNSACRLIHLYLTQSYEHQLLAGDTDLVTLKEQAYRFSLSFGVGIKAREQQRFIHQEGIKYSLSVNEIDGAQGPPRIGRVGYLDILQEFSLRLNSADASQIYDYLVKKGDILQCSNQTMDWDPLNRMKKELKRISEGRKEVRRMSAKEIPRSDVAEEEIEGFLSGGDGTPTPVETGTAEKVDSEGVEGLSKPTKSGKKPRERKPATKSMDKKSQAQEKNKDDSPPLARATRSRRTAAMHLYDSSIM